MYRLPVWMVGVVQVQPLGRPTCNQQLARNMYRLPVVVRQRKAPGQVVHTAIVPLSPSSTICYRRKLWRKQARHGRALY